MLKIREVTDPESCLSRALDGEFIFVLLGRDKAAPASIRFWVEERIRLGKNEPDDLQTREALALANAMEGVQRKETVQ